MLKNIIMIMHDGADSGLRKEPMKVCVAPKELPVLEDVGGRGASFRVSPCSCISGWVSQRMSKTCYSAGKRAPNQPRQSSPAAPVMSVRPAQLMLTHTDGFI